MALVKCPGCGKSIAVDDSTVAKTINCQACGKPIVVPFVMPFGWYCVARDVRSACACGAYPESCAYMPDHGGRGGLLRLAQDQSDRRTE